MSRGQMVIVADVVDGRVDPVITLLVAMGHEPFRLNSLDIPLNVAMAVPFGCGGPVLRSPV